MYLLKICRCCDSIVGELEIEDHKSIGMDTSVEIIGNVAYTLCPLCMQELEVKATAYYQ